MIDFVERYNYENLYYLPIALAPFLVWYFFIGSKIQKRPLVFYPWLMLIAAISVLTTDFTRVITILTLPYILIGTNKWLILNDEKSHNIIIPSFIIFIIAPYSWSGLDYFLWHNLIEDFCKWKYFCFDFI